MPVLLAAAVAVATVSAIRGVWSPCGLSMLSSITPMTESGRGHRFGVTAAWFVVGAVVGGACLGLAAGLGATAVRATGLGIDARLALGAAFAVVTAAIDLGLLGIELPIFKRQVDDAWLRRYRGWVYGAGFGWQIGAGVATYIMTAGVFLTIGLAVLTAAPLLAVAIGTLFGLVRGSAVYLGRRATDPAALGRVHERLDRFGPAARRAAAVVQILAAVVLAGLAVHPVLAVVLAVLGGLALTVDRAGTPEPA